MKKQAAIMYTYRGKLSLYEFDVMVYNDDRTHFYNMAMTKASKMKGDMTLAMFIALLLKIDFRFVNHCQIVLE